VTVLFLVDSTTVSGAEIVMLGCVDALIERGHKAVAFVSARNPRIVEELRTRGVTHAATASFSAEVIRTTMRPAALSGFLRAFSAVRQELRAFMEQHGVGVVHSISYPASLYGALGVAGGRARHIWHEHNIKRIHFVNRPIYRFVARHCDVVVGPSDAVTNNLARAGIPLTKLRTVYNGIDLSRFAPDDGGRLPEIRRELGLNAGERAVGLFGQMLPYKGHRTLIDAAPRILAECPDARFFFVGALENPPYQDELNAQIAENRLTDRVRFTGWRNDVQAIMRAMDVMVVGTTTPEPAALSLMEAGAVARPLVATRTGGTPEIVVDGETGLLYAPGDTTGLADQVVRLLKDPVLAGAVGAAGRTRVEERFSREKHLATMLALYGIPS
jgi:glycosyltransferase involved in cell wall biosynthesis